MFINNLNFLKLLKYKILKRFQGNGPLLSISLPSILPFPVTWGDLVHTKYLDNITPTPLYTVGNIV